MFSLTPTVEHRATSAVLDRPLSWRLNALFDDCAVFAATLLAACDTQVPQTVVVRANVASPSLDSLWLVEGNQCGGKRIRPGWYRDGLWIFRLSSTRGGVGAVTQELALCYSGTNAPATSAWHSLHGGGAPLIVLSCEGSTPKSCSLYMDQHTEGVWAEPTKR